MKRAVRRLICALLCLALLGGGTAFAAERERPALDELRVYLCSLLAGRAYRSGEDIFMSLSDFGEMYDIALRVENTREGFTADAPGLEIAGTRDSGYMTANCRYIYLPRGYLISGGELYLPLDALCRIFGVTAEIGEERVDLTTAQARLISGGEDYYEMNCDPQALYWLPRIGYGEAYEQPLAGIMGVCSVVLNRVADEDFPNTIFEVLYDNKHTVQFSPVTTLAMKDKPDEIYCIAAYLVLEGYNVVGESTYFVNPAGGANAWFEQNLSYVVTYGNHEFYKAVDEEEDA